MMIAMSFHVMVGVTEANSDRGSEDWSIDVSDQPRLSPMPDGTVTSLFDDRDISVMELGLDPPATYHTQDLTNLFYWTPNATYVFDLDAPESFSLYAIDGTKLVDESRFGLSVGSERLVPSNGKFVTVSDDILLVEYGVRSKDGAVAKMSTEYNFTKGNPKITASVLSADPLADWSVEWAVVPNRNATIASTADQKQVSLSDLAGKSPAFSTLSAPLRLGSNNFVVDWSDAKSGQLSVSSVADSKGAERATLTVAFDDGAAVIDPTIICTSTDPYPTGMNNQRKLFKYDGNYWLFYNSGNRISYRTSVDGVNWNAAVALQGGTSPSSGTGFDLACRNGVVAVTWLDTTSNLKFVKGNILSNNVTWSTSYTVPPFTVHIQPPSIAIGYDGSFYLTYQYSASPYVKVLWSATGSSQSRGSMRRMCPHSIRAAIQEATHCGTFCFQSPTVLSLSWKPLEAPRPTI
ncbi:MAG: hypothetical protein ISF22_11075 [Methanomassiliicoccus sp.]|nr:hypothetical protein [Methanomassiliicoccus sp.]